MAMEALEEKVDQIAELVAQLIDHVAEVRRSNRTIQERLDDVDRRLEEANRRLDDVDRRLEETNRRLDDVDRRLEETNRSLDESNLRIDRLETRITTQLQHFTEYAVTSVERLHVRIEKEAAERKAELAVLRRHGVVGGAGAD